MNTKKMNYKLAFHTAYLDQIGEKPTADNIEMYSVDPTRLVLVDETDEYWLVKTLDDGQAGAFLNAINKNTCEMVTADIPENEC